MKPAPRPPPVQRFEAPSPDAQPPGFQALVEEIATLWRHRGLLAAFALTDLRYRYVGSSMGFFWTAINPILELVTYTFVFNVLMGVRFHASGGTLHYSLFLFCGMVAWYALADGLQRATTSVTEHAHLIKKVNFPAGILPAHVVLTAVVNQLIRTAILGIAVVFLGDGLSWHVLLVPLVVAVQAAFVLGLGSFFATAHVYFRDTSHWLGAMLLPWMFITPIFYPPAAYPRRFMLLLQLNPMAHFVGIYQELILNQRLPDPRQVLVVVVSALAALVVGLTVFTHHRRAFADLA